MAKTKKQPVTIGDFHKMLVLAKWASGVFNRMSFEALSARLRNADLEGLADGDTRTKFSHAILDGNLFYLGDDAICTEAQFLAYDQNIVRHWKKITAKRNHEEGFVYTLKYYQYLTLLVTELYLDWYFNRPQDLLGVLNGEIARYNADPTIKEELPPATLEDLNKISFWEATGCGKTLMMNVNVLQYAHWAKAKPDHVILLTPDEGLTNQHLKDLALSDLPHFKVEKDSSLWMQKGVTAVGVIDVHKMISNANNKKKTGEKTFKTERFLGKNLVLVDEGHAGHSGGKKEQNGEWMQVRKELCEGGFSFEYSATFGQAVAKSKGADGVGLRALYARNILFDYSYKYFYADEYGKNSFILNMQEKHDEESVFEYLAANILKFVQQHEIFRAEPKTMADFLVEKPLCLFVGNTVTGSKENAATLSDVCEVVRLFARILSDRKHVEELFTKFLDNTPRLLSAQGFNILDHAFDWMMGPCGPEKGKRAYEMLLEHVLNAPAASNAVLTITHLKGPDEIALSVGTSEPFAVIHIGDSAGFLKQVTELPSVVVQVNPFDGSLFETVNRRDSKVNFLIGSRKFTQGWSCWRVSAMGLLNMGVTEGTQIIQLFGRGVRLKGRGYSLKRSNERPGDGCERPKGSALEKLETLNIFGLHADYMPKFREYLNEEGVHSQDEIITIDFKAKKAENLPKLEVCDVPDEYKLRGAKGFRKTQPRTLFDLPGNVKTVPHVIHEDFSYLQMLQKGTAERESTVNVKKAVQLPRMALPFLDYDALYRRLMKAKANKGFWNLVLEKERMIAFLNSDDPSWYTLYARVEDVTFNSFDKLAKIQELAGILLEGYMESFYKACQGAFEATHRKRMLLNLDVALKAYPEEKYKFDLLKARDTGGAWEQKLKDLKALVEQDGLPAQINQWSTNDVVALVFESPKNGSRSELLIKPVMWKDKKADLPFEIRPVTFDAPSELQFLRDLMAFYDNPANKHYFEDVDLYLLRNAAKKSQGIGFPEAGNFFPDFLLWLVDKKTNQQYLTFVDPKGFEHKVPRAKLEFYKTIKDIEARINEGQPNKLLLNSVLLSPTPYQPNLFDNETVQELEGKHLFFMNEGADVYIPKMFTALKKE